MLDQVEVGSSLLIVGFPLGFHDTVHHLPVVRQATIASSFGVRFQGQGYFLTDARTHRGTSGAPVVMRTQQSEHDDDNELPWKLLGVHSARMDMTTRDLQQDESLGLNCAWYADILMTLTEDEGVAKPAVAAAPEAAEKPPDTGGAEAETPTKPTCPGCCCDYDKQRHCKPIRYYRQLS